MLVDRLTDSRVDNPVCLTGTGSNTFVERGGHVVSCVDPAEGVDDILWEVLGMNAVDWVADILTRGDDQ